MTVPSGHLDKQNGKPIGSFHVTGSIEEPSTHEMVYPEFEDDFRPETSEEAVGGVHFSKIGAVARVGHSFFSTTRPSNAVLLRKLSY